MYKYSREWTTDAEGSGYWPTNAQGQTWWIYSATHTQLYPTQPPNKQQSPLIFLSVTFSFTAVSAANQREVYSTKVILRRDATEMRADRTITKDNICPICSTHLLHLFYRRSGHLEARTAAALTSRDWLRHVNFATTFVMCHPSSVNSWVSCWST